jgi:ankyrin repeat protein
VILLLNKGAEVNAQCRHYSNALQAASAKGHKQIVKLLLNKGANINAQGRTYSNALQAAAYAGNNKVLKRLIKKDSIRQLQDPYHRTLL